MRYSSTAVVDIDTSGIHALEELCRALVKCKIQVNIKTGASILESRPTNHPTAGKPFTKRKSFCLLLTAGPCQPWASSNSEAALSQIHRTHRRRQDVPDGWRCSEEIRSKGGGWRLKKMPKSSICGAQTGWISASISGSVCVALQALWFDGGGMLGDLTYHHSPVHHPP